MNTDFKRQLDDLIDRYLAGRLPFETFQRDYSTQFIDEIPDSAFSPEELDWYGAIHEKTEWTSPTPSTEERKHGWIDITDFRSWLAALREKGRRRSAS